MAEDTGDQPIPITAKKERDNRLLWVGELDHRGKPKRYFFGVPARDLTNEEVAALDKDTIKAMVAEGLYVHAMPKGKE